MLDIVKNQITDSHDDSVFINCKNDTVKFYNLDRHVIIPPISHERYLCNGGMDSLLPTCTKKYYPFRNPMKDYKYKSFMDYEVARIKLYENLMI